MDYQKELNKLSESGNYWKPKAGQFKVKALSELEKAEPFIKKKTDEEGKEIEERTEQFQIKLSVDGKEVLWTFGKGKTPASTYGQLVDLATKRNNSLKDVEFIVVVKFDNNKNNYTIVA